jgi:ABC-type glycerol-3-phosphate transport system permease component
MTNDVTISPAELAPIPLLPTPADRPTARRKRRPIDPGRLVTHLVLMCYCLSSAAAFVWYLMTSLKSNNEFLTKSPWSPPSHLRFSNFTDAWRDAGLGRLVLDSFYVTIVSVGVATIVSTMAAYVLARVPFPGRGLLGTLFLTGMLLPTFASMIPLYFLLQDLHLLGTLNGLILVYIANQIPLSIFILRGFYASLPVELEEAAYLDGASPTRTFWTIVLPQTYAVTVSLVVLNTITIWNEFVLALILLTDQHRQTLAVGLLGLSVQADYSGDWVQLFAGLVISSVPMVVLFVVAQDRIARGIQFGGIKG